MPANPLKCACLFEALCPCNFINFSHITVAVNVSYTAALQTMYQYQVLTKYSHPAGPRKSVLKLYAHNITDAMDNTIVTHFMHLNAEWSFYGSHAFSDRSLSF